MKQRPWKIRAWGFTGEKGKPDTVTHYTLDNREEKADEKIKDASPLLTMKVCERWSKEELHAYLVQIRDALNAAGIVEGTIEDPDQPK